MERKTDLITARRIMGGNFIGPDELRRIKDPLGICDPLRFEKMIPPIELTEKELERIAKGSVLILGMPEARDREPLTIMKLKAIHGTNPDHKEPCLYNQDWYNKEPFACDFQLELKWYALSKTVDNATRGIHPNHLVSTMQSGHTLPHALLTAYIFFAFYFHSQGHILWAHDYVWCEDTDSNKDRVYTGRYADPLAINKNGFSIHRHLSIKNNYGVAEEYR